MGLLDQLQAYIQANTPRSTRPPVSPAQVIDQGLLGGRIGQIPQRAEEIKQGLLNVPQDLAQLNSPAMKKRVNDALYGTGGAEIDREKGMQVAMDFLQTTNPVAGLAGIVSPSAAKALNTTLRLPDDDIFKVAVANTPGAQIDESGLLMRVQRNQTPDQALQPSVRGGVFYLPEGAAQAKYYSTGKNGYGGTEKIAGETLIANPLFAKGGTGGKAPESAYDQLAGKGAYQAMRTDALKGYGGYGASYSGKVQRVSEFLDKYAPELKDHADYIVENSKQGNQLAYALQEAAVGSAVRKAGHDAVLGYSNGKAGPFLSEVFDVRESVYPDKFGGSEVWDSFNGQPTGLLSYADEAAQKAKKKK